PTSSMSLYVRVPLPSPLLLAIGLLLATRGRALDLSTSRSVCPGRVSSSRTARRYLIRMPTMTEQLDLRRAWLFEGLGPEEVQLTDPRRFMKLAESAPAVGYKITWALLRLFCGRLRSTDHWLFELMERGAQAPA